MKWVVLLQLCCAASPQAWKQQAKQSWTETSYTASKTEPFLFKS
jgi:hypothetical protein